MSRVFVAEDTRLGRKVVVKVLPPEMAGSISVERFTREIQVAARLQHPHIVPLLSAGEINSERGDGTALPYYTMPLVQGESLRSRIARDGRLTVEESTRLASEVADALEYAHGEGVVHRDIKPENILLSGGHALVVDFGIAKALDVSRTNAGQSVTATGMSLGTPAYMSPEQAAGESEIDARSDIYSLAAVLYEMLSGQAPFAGPTAMAVMAKRFAGPPAGLRTLDATIPSGIEHAVGRGMAMERDGRFSTAAEFRTALSAPMRARAPVSASDEKSIAVLPFANMSADAESEYFSDGLTEEIINALVQLPGLHVSARTSSFAFKGKQLEIGEIGARLKVATVLEGSVRRAGKRLRVTAQLIKVSDGFHMWSERYDRDLDDVFEIQDEIARAIAGQMRLTLTARTSETLVRPPTENMEAHDLYLRGRHLLARRGTGLALSAELFRRAIAADPGFAAPYAGLADSETLSATYGYAKSAGAYERARPAARRSLELDGTLAESHMAVGLCESFIGWDFERGEAEFRRASEINPSWGLPLSYLAVLLVHQPGRSEECASLLRRATKLEPLTPLTHGIAAILLPQLGLMDDAWNAAERALELDPSFVLGLWAAGLVQQWRGHDGDAISSLSRAVELHGRSPMTLALSGCALAVCGRRNDALAIIEELESRGSDSHFAARVRWALGDHLEAISLFGQAVRERAAVFWHSYFPGQDGLWEDPRWHEILRSAGLTALIPVDAMTGR